MALKWKRILGDHNIETQKFPKKILNTAAKNRIAKSSLLYLILDLIKLKNKNYIFDYFIQRDFTAVKVFLFKNKQ